MPMTAKPQSTKPTMNSVPAVQRRRPARDLVTALWLRPRDIFELYGIPSSTLSDLCNHADPAIRIPSVLLAGRNGRRGLRLIKQADFVTYMEKWATGPSGPSKPR